MVTSFLIIQSVGNVGPKMMGEGESQEREGEKGRGLNTPQWDSI
jgi:hypothetical protein